MDTVYVKLLRTTKLRKQTVRLKVGVEPNNHFETPFTQYKNSSSWSADANMHSAVSFVINFHERYSQPFYWGTCEPFFGKFSANKFLAMNSYMGWTSTDWSNAGMSGQKIMYGKLDYFARYFGKYLLKRAEEGNPLLEEDGSYMQMGNDYKVDYSSVSSN